MKNTLFILLMILANILFSQDFTSKDYNKKEVYIKMRDGVKLFTTIYSPKDSTIDYPILLSRTTYSCKPYGEYTIPESIMYNSDLIAKGYIFVLQDVRGRWMSEGVFENTKPPYSFWDKTRTDEVTDAWDTAEWLSKNIKRFNGNIGVHGNSYLGWSTLTAAVSNHPSIKAVLAMAPVTDFYFEDFTRYGLVAINYAPILNAFGIVKNTPTKSSWYSFNNDYITDIKNNLTEDYYQYFLDLFTLKNINDKLIDKNNLFWNKLIKHYKYDEFRQKRNWLNYLEDIKCQVLIAGGWNDEQNLYGILNSFKTIEKKSPKANVKLLMGPWAHSHPKKRDHKYYLGDIFYGYDLSEKYQQDIQVPYFEYYLKGNGTSPDYKTQIFDTGKKEWIKTASYPFLNDTSLTLYLNKSGNITNSKTNSDSYSQYISDPFHPIPFMEDDDFYHVAPKPYMTADQRHTSKRPDVLTFVTDTLENDITVLGEPKAYISFETDHTAADLYVKIIDVYPMNRKSEIEDKPNIKMNGYQQLIRMGYIRGRYRDSFSEPKPFKKNNKYKIKVPLLEIFHTFKKGHKIMVQIQSSAFPLFDINPQNYLEDIYQAKTSDFTKSLHKVYSDSKIVLPLKTNE